MNRTINKLIDNDILQDYLDFICFDGYLSYIYREEYSYQNFELLFSDRYLGFTYEDDIMVYKSDCLKEFINKNGILVKVELKEKDLKKLYDENLKANGFKAIINTCFTYPDESSSFSYYSFILINDILENEVKVTKIANIDPNVNVTMTKEDFHNILDIYNDNIALYICKPSEYFEKLSMISSKEDLKEILNLCGISRVQLNRKYDQQKDSESTILQIANIHKSKLNDYLKDGVTRSEYSTFVRKISEALTPSLRCLLKMKELNISISEELNSARNNLESTLFKVSNNILSFFLRTEQNFFDRYYDQMINLDTVYQKYQEEYHKLMMNIL